jgi:mono/diheme cytochrome c family protein
MSSNSIKSWLLTAAVAFSFTLHAQDKPNAEEGKKLYEANNCGSCHALDKKVVGPALRGVHTRRSEEWLVKWIRNNEKFRTVEKDADAIALYNEYGGAAMNIFENLTPAQVLNIVEYIKTAPEPKKAAPVADANANQPKDDSTTIYILLLLVLVFGSVLLVLSKVKSTLRKVAAEQNPDQYPSELKEKKNFFQRVLPAYLGNRNPIVLTLFSVAIVAIVGGYYGYKFSITEVGVQKGYAPKQPIAFSHKLHAGELNLDCKYCHSTVEESKQASIPALNTCMNCHKGVQLTDKYNGEISPEIKKIYAALDYNPEAKPGEEYGDNPKPIRWVRIHNLPDHAYFNHSQHVKVGKLQCQSCHGAVEKMEVVQQHSSLQMGWCIDCHRRESVDIENNNYYKALHEKVKADKSGKYLTAEGKVRITPAMNGGLECSKCHY